MRMNVQVTYIFIGTVSHKDSFRHKGKSQLGIGLFIHELAQGAFDLPPVRDHLADNTAEIIALSG